MVGAAAVDKYAVVVTAVGRYQVAEIEIVPKEKVVVEPVDDHLTKPLVETVAALAVAVETDVAVSLSVLAAAPGTVVEAKVAGVRALTVAAVVVVSSVIAASVAVAQLSARTQLCRTNFVPAVHTQP